MATMARYMAQHKCCIIIIIIMQQLECVTYSITCMSCLYVHVFGHKVIYLSIYLSSRTVRGKKAKRRKATKTVGPRPRPT